MRSRESPSLCFTPRIEPRNRWNCKNGFKNEEAVGSYETVRVRKDGTPVDVAVACPIRNAAGQVIGAATIARDITERKHLQEALKEANRHKDEFLAILSHELRNPLAPLRNAVQILKTKGSADPEVEWSREVIDRQIRHMARLLDDLLDVSRINRGKLELRKQRIELTRVVENVLEIGRPLIEKSGLGLTVRLPQGPVLLEGDPVRLTQVFSNLLNNAAKYTERGGHIELTAERQPGAVMVSVKDDGIGIPADICAAFSTCSAVVPRREAFAGRDRGRPFAGKGAGRVAWRRRRGPE